jgi:hypothetical protein
MLVAEDEKGFILRNKRTWHFVFIARTCLLCPSVPPRFTYDSPKQNIISCKSGASLVGHDQSGLCTALKTVMNCSKPTYITYWEVPLSTFWYVNDMTVMICCLVQVWAEDIVWDIVHKINRFNRKKLHEPLGLSALQQTVYITLYIQDCAVFVHWAVWVKEWAIVTVLQAIKYRFYGLLTKHHGTILVNHLLDAQIIFSNMCILQYCTCFEQYCAHPQEVNCINTASGVVTLCKWLACAQVKRGLFTKISWECGRKCSGHDPYHI